MYIGCEKFNIDKRDQRECLCGVLDMKFCG
jgi:hypothetical protein